MTRNTAFKIVGMGIVVAVHSVANRGEIDQIKVTLSCVVFAFFQQTDLETSCF